MPVRQLTSGNGRVGIGQVNRRGDRKQDSLRLFIENYTAKSNQVPRERTMDDKLFGTRDLIDSVANWEGGRHQAYGLEVAMMQRPDTPWNGTLGTPLFLTRGHAFYMRNCHFFCVDLPGLKMNQSTSMAMKP
jgi:hypothetical protein